MKLNEFINEMKNIFPWIQNSHFEKFEIYKNYLQIENEKYNLTRLSEKKKIYGNYFFESIFVYQNLLKNKKQKILDVGSGSGIPGIILAIVFNLSKITIVEANTKKCLFMNNLIKELNLKNVVVINKRVEELNSNFREKFDFGTSRALASLKIVCEILTPYLKINGILIQPKSIFLENEIQAAKTMIKELNLKIISIDDFNFENKKHKVISLKKLNFTNLKYPRDWKDIIKNE